MKKRFPLWTLGLLGILLVILVPILYFLPNEEKPSDPAAYLPEKPVHVDHADIVNGDFKTGQDVTRACLECHPDSATGPDEDHPLDVGIQSLRCPLAG